MSRRFLEENTIGAERKIKKEDRAQDEVDDKRNSTKVRNEHRHFRKEHESLCA